MSKLSKLIKHPILFLQDAVKNTISKNTISKNTISKNTISLNMKHPEYKLPLNKKNYIYLPWMLTHGDKLIKQLNVSDVYEITPLELFESFDENKRKFLSQLSRNNPQEYRKLLLKHLIPIKNQLSGAILTFDWHPVMRIFAKICQELNIPTYLVLHESVFLDKEKFYWHEETNIKLPICDHIITWGDLQKGIFIERGVSESKIIPLGSPKLDVYINYKPMLSREEFASIYGLDSDKKIFLYALQPMDVQIEQKFGIKKQREAVNDLMDYCERYDIQLILREPPAPVNTLFRQDRERIQKHPNFVIDKARDYLTPPEESIYHADIVFSVNSTMLFEAVLLRTKAISTKYFEFTQIWTKINLPFAKKRKKLFDLITKYIDDEKSFFDTIDIQWAERQLSNGSFDGKSTERIKKYLENSINAKESKNKEEKFENIVEYIAISNTAILSNTGKYLPQMLNTKHIITPINFVEASKCDGFIQWGNRQTNPKIKVASIMKEFGKIPYIIEDGFIRSVSIGLSGAPGLSITLCGKSAYYDAFKVSNFEKVLNSERVFTSKEIEKAKFAMDNIVKNHISKYNDSPFLPVTIGRKEKSKVLIIDQRYGDQSVPSAMASEKDFQDMLIDAITDNPDSDIIIKRHPDAIKGGKGSYYDDSKVGYTKDMENVFLIDYDIHPHQLLELVDKVYVVSSGLGFEALLYGREVHCYGMPFYANWGVTIDKKTLDRRTKKRTIEEIFYISYIEYSRYYSPKLNSVCDINDVIEYIVENR